MANQPVQLPFYKTGEREMGAPPGFQPQGGQPLTQRNNGGPVGLGQPARSTPMAAPGGRGSSPRPMAPPQPPMAGTGQPPHIYAPNPQANPAANIWANRNTMEPLELILRSFLEVHGRLPQPQEVQMLMQTGSNDQIAEQLLTPIQSAILQR